MDSTSPLPDDAALLKAMVAAQQVEIERLNFIIAKLRRAQFGRRSEQLDETIGQLELSLEELEAVRAERTVAASPITPGTESERAAREPLPAHLPREQLELLDDELTVLERLAAGDHEALEALDVVGQIGVVLHASSVRW